MCLRHFYLFFGTCLEHQVDVSDGFIHFISHLRQLEVERVGVGLHMLVKSVFYFKNEVFLVSGHRCDREEGLLRLVL